MKKLNIPVGISDFEKIRNGEFYYIDKSGLITEILKEKAEVTLITRPRRFGKTLGMSDRRIFWTVVMPTAGPGIASGTVLAFARAIGEYGATSMLAGNILGKTRTVSVAIASETAAGNYGMAGFWVVVILIISFVIVAAINIVSGKGMKMGRWM